jgi:sugar lactone lactonase YvrE
VAQAGEEIGPIAVGPNGDVYYATRTGVFRVPGGTGAPTPVADGVAAPHGLAVTVDGSLLVCDTGNGLVKRIDLASGLTETWARLGEPRGIDISADGTVYIVDASVSRVVHLMADGRRLGFVGPRFHDPYDVEVAGGGTVYVLDSAAAGRLYRVAPDRKTTVVARR